MQNPNELIANCDRTKLAKTLGCSRSKVSRILSGHTRRVDPSLVHKMADELTVTRRELLAYLEKVRSQLQKGT